MVRGLDDFRAYFSDCQDEYVLIGGAACELWLEANRMKARSTKDLDIVLIVEALGESFIRKFWEYIRRCDYRSNRIVNPDRKCYRFENPVLPSAPIMIELFSRRPDSLEPARNRLIAPLTITDDVSALSAILLDESYYSLIMKERTLLSGLNVVSPAGLIALKVRAYHDLNERRLRGELVDSYDIKKHKYDVLRLGLLLDGISHSEVPQSIKAEIDRFIRDCRNDSPDWKNLATSLGMPKNAVDERILDRIESSFHQTQGEQPHADRS